MAHLMRPGSHMAERSVVAVSQPAATIAVDATLDDALRELRNAGSEYLVVIGVNGRLVGVLGRRELVAAWASSPEAFATTPVTAVLDSVPATVAPTATVRTVARVMRDFCSDVVIVVDHGRVLVGAVTVADIVAGIADDHGITG